MQSTSQPSLKDTTHRKMVKEFFAKATVRVYRPGNGYAFIPGETPEILKLFLEELFQDKRLDPVAGTTVTSTSALPNTVG